MLPGAEVLGQDVEALPGLVVLGQVAQQVEVAGQPAAVDGQRHQDDHRHQQRDDRALDHLARPGVPDAALAACAGPCAARRRGGPGRVSRAGVRVRPASRAMATPMAMLGPVVL